MGVLAIVRVRLKIEKTNIFIKVRQKTEVSHSTGEITSVFPLD